MALDPKLSEQQLWVIAQDTPNLTDELLEQIKYHPNAYLELQDWATAALLVGAENAPSPAAPPEETNEDTPDRGKNAHSNAKTHRGVNGKTLTTMILVPLVFLLLIAGLWVKLHTGNQDTLEQSGQSNSDPQSDQALTTDSPDPQSGESPKGTAARAGLGSFECETQGQGVSCWGWISDEEIRPLTGVPGLESTQIDHLAVGRGYAVAVDTDGNVYAWGKNDKGQLGIAAGDPQWEAVVVGQLGGRAEDLVAGEEHACALVDGSVWCFGSNRVGQIRGVPTDEVFGLTQIDGVIDATSLGSSGYSTWAIVPNGSLAWGNNKFGQVAPGDSAATLVPTETPTN